ncbi:glycosyltransferase family 4 protein [Thalassobacillus devorans]|uniref:glycosyltransferase family 4 protein n=1 Tax=Thalassobacillus devorans TaxID=279813 RepID=UPI001593495B|nr:glycosyltransferase family 1 protein [Thalassobacillus devorans]
MKTIMVDLRTLSTKPSGIGFYTYEYVKRLQLTNSLKVIGVTDVCKSPQIKELKDIGINILSYSKEIKRNTQVFSYFKFIKDMIKNKKPDFFWEPNHIYPLNLKNLNHETKLIVTIHDVLPISNPEFFPKLYSFYFKYFVGKTLNLADAVFYVSKHSKTETEKFFNKNINVKPSLVTNNFVNFPDLLDTNDEGYFLYVGNIEKRKGILILLDAYEKYLKNGGNLKLILAGNVREEDVEKKLNSLITKLQGKLSYRGYISNEEKQILFQSCSAFIYPSYAEGFGIPPLEAIFYNKAVIISDLPVFKEIFGDIPNYFKLDKNYSNEVNNLFKCLMSFKRPESIDVIKLQSKYDPDILVRKMEKFLYGNM